MEQAILLIRLSVALTMVLFGIHQFMNPGQWIDYIPGGLRKFLITTPENTMRMHAIINILLGVWFAVGIYPLVGSWATLLWWVSILPFAFYKDWRIGLRDLSITASVLAVILLRNV